MNSARRFPSINAIKRISTKHMQKIENASIRPRRSMELLSHDEIDGLLTSTDEVFRLFRDVALAVLNTDAKYDEASRLLAEYADFHIQVIPQSRGLKLDVFNAPAPAFVDGKMIRGIQEHLFSALRDIVYTDHEISAGKFDLQTSSGITDAVFRILRNADVVRANQVPNLVVCWGGHSIRRVEYDYSKEVGYQLGLRGLDIVTGCGIGAMKGPMKGAAVGHAKQQIRTGRYIGLSEPGIIASESPNAIVNELVILPDIEKRLEAFVRLAHCIIVFPGGAGTVEEVLYILSLLMHPDNRQKFTLIFAAAPASREYFADLDRFLRQTLGDEVAAYYQIITGNADEVARQAKAAVERVRKYRMRKEESYAFNWSLSLDLALQKPFIPTHENMAALSLDRSLPPHQLAANLRCVFSGIVAGNVKAYGIAQIAEHGPYQLRGDPQLSRALDGLLTSFIRQRRMKLSKEYQPCYHLSEIA